MTSREKIAHREKMAYDAIKEIGMQIADRWADGFQKRPTQQLILQKVIDPAVRHIMSSMLPWIIGIAILFLVLLVCTVVTCVIVLRSGSVAAFSVSPSLMIGHCA